MSSQANVKFIYGQNQLGQVAQGLDFVRGLQLYGVAPGSFAVTATQAVFSISDAESKGIVNDYADETKPQATYLITTKGNTGDTINFSVTEVNPNGLTTSVNLGTYTTGSGATTIAAQGAAIAAVINAGTYIHGYTASFLTATLTITGRAGLGVSLNTGSPVNVTITGAYVGTLTQPASATVGVASNKAIWHYLISEFFRANPTGKLWINFNSTVSSTYADIVTLQQNAQGECRMIGVYDPTSVNASTVDSNVTLLNNIMLTLPQSMQCNIVYAPNIKGVSDLSTLINGQTHTFANPFTSICIGQDGKAVGAQLFVTSGASIPCLGYLLGTSSSAAVSQNIGEVGAFNASNGIELDTPAFTNGQLYASLAASLVDQIDSYRYIFLCKYPSFSGTYFNNDYTYTTQTSDYSTISRNLTIQKSIRGVYNGVLPLLKSRIDLNADGTISQVTAQIFDTAASQPLVQMVKDGDLSSGMIAQGALVSGVVNINPTQNVLSTNKVAIGLKLLPQGVADYIEVGISFTAKLK